MAKWHHRQGAIKEASHAMEGDHVVIIGPYGNVWHGGSFPTAEAAEKYLRDFWGPTTFDPSEWRLACASIMIEALEPSFRLPSASADTHPQGRRRKAAPFMGSAVGEAETHNPYLSPQGSKL